MLQTGQWSELLAQWVAKVTLTLSLTTPQVCRLNSFGVGQRGPAEMGGGEGGEEMAGC